MNHIDIYLYTTAPSGLWRVSVRGKEVLDGRLHAWIERDASGRYQSRFPRTPGVVPFHHQHDLQLLSCDRGWRLRFQPPRSTTHALQQPRPDRRRTAEAGNRRAGLQDPRRALIAAGRVARSNDDWWRSRAPAWLRRGCPGRWPSCSPLRNGRSRSTKCAAALIGTADPHPGPSGRTSTQLGYGYLNTAAAVAAARRIGLEKGEQSAPRLALEELDEAGLTAPSIVASDVARAPDESSAGKCGCGRDASDGAGEDEAVAAGYESVEDAEDDDELDEFEPVEEEIDTPFMWEDVQEALEAINEIEG